MSVLDGELTKIAYEEIKGFEGNNGIVEKIMLHHRSVCCWHGNEFLHDINRMVLMVPKSWLSELKNNGVERDKIQDYIDGSYYELVALLLTKAILKYEDSKFVYSWLLYFMSLSELLGNKNIETNSLPSEIKELLEKESKNSDKKANRYEPKELNSFNLKILRYNLSELYATIVNAMLFLIYINNNKAWIDKFFPLAKDKPYFMRLYFPKIGNYEPFIGTSCTSLADLGADWWPSNGSFEELSEAAKIRRDFSEKIKQLNGLEKRRVDFLSQNVHILIINEYLDYILRDDYLTPLFKSSRITCQCQLFTGSYELDIPLVLLRSDEYENGTLLAYYTYQAMLAGKVMFKHWCTPSEFAGFASPKTFTKYREPQ